MKHFTSLLLCISLFVSCYATYPEEWYREFKPWTGATLLSACADTTGNLYTLSCRNYGGYGGEIRKYDSGGIIQWSDTFVTADTTYSYHTMPRIIALGPSGNIYVIAEGISKSTMLKYSSSGSLLWTTDFNYTQFLKMLISKDEKIYLINRSTTNIDTIYATKLDSSGSITWNKNIVNDNYLDFDVNLNQHENLIICYDNLLQIHRLCSVDSSGTALFNIQSYNMTFQRSVIDKADNIIIHGFSPQLYICDQTGNWIDTITFPTPDVRDVKFDSFGNRYLLCQINSAIINVTSWTVCKTDSDFNVLWIKNFTGSNSQENFAWELNLHNDNSIFVTTGERLINANQTAWDLLSVQELDSAGNDMQRMLHYCDDSYQLRNTHTFFDNHDNVYVSQGVGSIPHEYFYSLKFCSSCNTNIDGSVYHDMNQDCIHDTTEENAKNQIVVLLPDSFYTTTNANGKYEFSKTIGTYQIDMIPKKYWTKICPANSINITLDSTNLFSSGNNFAIDDTNNVRDFSVHIGFGQARVGFNCNVSLLVDYNGTIPMPGILKFSLDSNFHFVSSDHTPLNISSDTITWNIDTLQPSEQELIQFVLHVDSSASNQHFFSDFAIIEPVTGDEYSADNVDSIFDQISGAWDPNKKEVYPQGIGATGNISSADSILRYTIHFQNTGNDTAFTVMIKDLIDNNLDLGTFEMIGASSNYTYSISGRTITWIFSNINLPDSGRSFEGSQGFLSYAIHLKNGLHTGTSIYNYADIYFDYNLPVSTNTVMNTINNVISVEEIISHDITLFPNPNNGIIYVSAGNNREDVIGIKIADITGKIIYTENKFVQVLKINTRGIYIISFRMKDGSQVNKKVVVSG